jgi:hypothetical protein
MKFRLPKRLGRFVRRFGSVTYTRISGEGPPLEADVVCEQ